MTATGITTALDQALETAIRGEAVPEEQAALFADADSGLLPELCAAAAQPRDRGQGTPVTFSPQVFIPLPMLCPYFCVFCTFRRYPSSSQKLYMSPDEVLEVAMAGQRLGCTEALFTLGERPEQRYPEAKEWLEHRGYRTTLQYLADMCKLVAQETDLLPHANPGTMRRSAMAALPPFNPPRGLMLESTSEALYATGGPHEFAPSKRPRVRLRTIQIAGELGVPFTTGLLVGIGETRRDRIESLLAIRRLHVTHGHIQDVTIHNFRPRHAPHMPGPPTKSQQDFMWTVAVARLLLGPDMNLQVPPNLSAQDYECYLDAGINDWGGVSPLTIDFVNPEAPWPGLAELRDRSKSMGFELKPRLPVYPEFFLESDRFLPAALKAKVAGLSDDEGYVKGGIQRYAGFD